MSDPLRASVLHAVERTPAPTRLDHVQRMAGTLGLAVVVGLAIFLAKGGIRVTGRPAELVAETAAAAALVACLVAWLGVSRGRSVLGRPGGVLLGLILLAPVVLLGVKLAISAGHLGMTACWPERPGFRCLRLSLMISAAPLVALLVLRRRSDPVHPALTGAILGLTASAFTWVLVDLWCPVAYLPHLLLGHVLPLAIVTVAGALLGRFVLAVRAQ